MSAGRIHRIAILAGVVPGAVAVAAYAGPAELAPIDPICQPNVVSECVMTSIDPGIFVPEAKLDRWRTLEVRHFEGWVCSFVGVAQSEPSGCIDMNEFSRITPNVDLPGAR